MNNLRDLPYADEIRDYTATVRLAVSTYNAEQAGYRRCTNGHLTNKGTGCGQCGAAATRRGRAA